MFDELRDLYQEVILDHGRKPRNLRRIDGASRSARGENPMCGDKLQVFLNLGEAGSIADVAFEGRGCAISMASASLMTEVVKGKSPAQAEALGAAFREVATGHDCPHCAAELADDLERLQPLSGVAEYPSRVKCATLAWHTLSAALAGGEPATTEGGTDPVPGSGLGR